MAAVKQNLTSANRARHTSFMKGFMEDVPMKSLDNKSMVKMNSPTWKWGKMGRRLGEARSADGIVFKADEVDGMVYKVVFGETGNYDKLIQEYETGKLMSQKGVGPKIYAAYSFVCPSMLNYKNVRTNIKNWPVVPCRRSTGQKRCFDFNLFQYWHGEMNAKYALFKIGILIIMEDLYDLTHATESMSLYSWMQKGRQIPYPELERKVNIMHSLKICHGDMHQRNIHIRHLKNGSVVPIIIDFGRARTNCGWFGDDKGQLKAYKKYYQNHLHAGHVSSHRPPPRPSSHHSPAIPAQPFIASSLGLTKRGADYFFKGKRGLVKKQPTIPQLKVYAAQKGVNVAGLKKAQIMEKIAKFKRGSRASASPMRPASGRVGSAASLGITKRSGVFLFRGKRGLIKTQPTIAQLKVYAAKKGVNVSGLKKAQMIEKIYIAK